MEKWIRARYQPNLPLEGDRRVTASPEHVALSRQAASDYQQTISAIRSFQSSLPQ